MPRKPLTIRKLISILRNLEPEGEVFILSGDAKTLKNARVDPISYGDADPKEWRGDDKYANQGVLLWTQ